MSHSQKQEIDCIVIGAGPVGLAMAAGLVHCGLTCRVFDKAPQPTAGGRAAVIWSRTIEILHSIDEQLGASLLANGNRAYGTSIFDESGRIARLDLEALSSRYNYALMIPQSKIEELMNSHLEQIGLTVERHAELVSLEQDSDLVKATVRHQAGEELVQARWLIGCDGAHSTVRKQLSLPFLGESQPHWWIVGELEIEGPLPQDEMSVYWNRGATLTFLPFGERRFRFVSTTDLEPTAEPPKQPTLETVQDLLDKRGLSNMKVTAAKDLGYFRINERQVPEYRVGRVFLAGDSAHIHSPVGGQGLNMGVQDTHNLAWKLALVEKGLAPPALLDSYHNERHPIGSSMLKGAGTGTRIMTIRSRVGQALRSKLTTFASSLPLVQRTARTTAAALNLNYRKSQLSVEFGESTPGWKQGRGISAGDRVPDVVLDSAETREKVHLFRILTSPHFHILFFQGLNVGGNWDLLERMSKRLLVLYPSFVKIHYIAHDESSPSSTLDNLYLDTSADVHYQFGALENSLYIIRPDGYVGHRSQPCHRKLTELYLTSVIPGRVNT
jgi:2-polyprenyl-6-methoxyphenol hydroxylase-like FAD-dependent oxidoreductase